ncbi:DMT family transporter [Parasphingopyxis algicola]|uniref:DMT family transporter n=1 Tax=Parasphingopyxis algicola TaxID=2026624 RepID=UPI0015A4672C|nr:DMT family transporter [Parasphingopyxis algicola]QLC25989.1 DMT family transporter [Parasphingopyxis algicola]
MNQPVAADADTNFWTPRILLSFLLISLIWGSTWIVIKDQLASVPPVWSVSYRFLAASLAMFLVVAVRRQPLMLDRRGHFWAVLLGCSQFALNFNFVYGAELFITSGLVAVMFALLMVPNAILGRIFLGQRITASFVIGSGIAIAGIALLFVQEYRLAPVGGSAVFIGIGLTLVAILCASTANILQASEGAGAHPILTLIAWAMLWGALFDALFALATVGPPVIEMRLGYLAGVLYLGVIGSAVTFPIYFGLIREIGAAQAAYTGVIVPIVAMVFSTFLEGYVWSPLAIAGAVLAIAGLLYAMRARRPKRPRIPA